MSKKKKIDEEPVESKVPESKGDFTKLPRRKIRYWLYRFQKEVTENVEAEGSPEGLREYFEGQTWFSDWKSFAFKWDVGEDNPLEIVPLKESHLKRWNREAFASAKELPVVKK